MDTGFKKYCPICEKRTQCYKDGNGIRCSECMVEIENKEMERI